MSDEATPGLATSEPAGGDKLDSIISTAIDKSEAPPETASAPSDGTGSERPRDDKGRFAHKDSAAKASEPEQASTATTAEPKTEAQPAIVQPVEPPHTWSADDKAKFATWPSDVQLAVVDRYNAMQADYTRKTQQAAELEKSAAPLLQAIEPFKQYLTQLGPQLGRAPHELVRDVLAAEYHLRTGSPQERYQAFFGLARTYNIDLAAFTRGEIPQPNPEFEQVRQELSELRNWKSNFETQVQQQQTEQAVQYLDSLKSATDEHGKLRYPLYEQVRIPIAYMLRNEEAKTYDEAYQKAAAPINAHVAAELNSREQHAAAQRKEAVAKAEKAAPVRSSGSQPGGSAKSKGLDAILEEQVAKHFG